MARTLSQLELAHCREFLEEFMEERKRTYSRRKMKMRSWRSNEIRKSADRKERHGEENEESKTGSENRMGTTYIEDVPLIQNLQ